MRTLRTAFLVAILMLLAFADSTEIKRPGSDADMGSATWVTTNCGIGSYQSNTTDGTNGRDAAGQATSVLFTKAGAGSGAKETSRTYYGWSSTSNTYTALTLNINSSAAANLADLAGEACIAYSLNGGGTWTVIRCTTASWAQTTDTVTLSTTQSLSSIEVGVCMLRVATSGALISSAQVTVYDIWTSGTTTAAPAGNGSGSGTSVQPVQFN